MIANSLRTKINEIVSLVDYDKVILFGSRARGDYTSDSDFDLLVILKSVLTIHEKMDISSQLRKQFATKMMDADVLVKDCKDINYLKNKPGSVVRNALIEGVLL